MKIDFSRTKVEPWLSTLYQTPALFLHMLCSEPASLSLMKPLGTELVYQTQWAEWELQSLVQKPSYWATGGRKDLCAF